MPGESPVQQRQEWIGNLESNTLLPAVEHVLGVPVLLPEAVRQDLLTIERPADVRWEGQPIWKTAFVAGLRAIATARAGAREQEAREGRAPTSRDDIKKWNKSWNNKQLKTPDNGKLDNAIHKYAYDRLEVTRRQPASDQAERRVLAQQVSRAASNLSIANTLGTRRELPSDAWADREGPRATLQEYFGHILRWFTFSPPREQELLVTKKPARVPGAVALIAPTGIGKTKMGADWLVAGGLGDVGPNGQPKKALWITPTQALITDGLNPDKTLQRCLPEHVKTAAIWEGNKDAATVKDAELLMVTVKSVEEALNSGLIKKEQISALVFDEAQDALPPRVANLLAEFDCPKALLTATPTRSETRSLLLEYHYAQPKNRREAIEEGMLRSVRILTMREQNMQDAEELAAQTAVEQFILQGKKCTIYCQPGGNNAQAKEITKRIMALMKAHLGDDAFDPNHPYAVTIGQSETNSLALAKRFEEQEGGAAAVCCQMLGVGWDYPELDGSIWVGEQGDYLALVQESGRSLRPRADGSAALWVEITVPPPEGREAPLYCLAQTVGLSYILGPEVVIGPKSGLDDPSPGSHDRSAGGGSSRPRNPPRPGAAYMRDHGSHDTDDTGGLPDWDNDLEPPARPMPGAAPAGGRPPDHSAEPEPDATPQPSFASQLSAPLQRALVPAGTHISEIIISADRSGRYVPPPGRTITDEYLANMSGLPVNFVQYHLESVTNPMEAVPWSLIRTLSTERQPGDRSYFRYYDDEALGRFLETHPFPEVSAERLYTLAGIARILNAPHSLITEAITTLELPEREPSRPPAAAAAAAGIARVGKTAPRYSTAELQRISDWVERTPRAEPGDTLFSELRTQYPFAPTLIESGERVLKRPEAGSPRLGAELYVEPDVVQRIEAEHRKRQQLVSLSSVAANAGVPQGVLERSLTEEEAAFAQANRFAPPGGTRFAKHVHEEMVPDLLERAYQRLLQHHEMPYGVIQRIVNAQPEELRAFMDERGLGTSRSLPGGSRGAIEIRSWTDFRQALEHFGARPGVPIVEWDQSNNQHYVHELKLQLGIPGQIMRLPEASSQALPVQFLKQQFKASDSAFAGLLQLAGVDPGTVGDEEYLDSAVTNKLYKIVRGTKVAPSTWLSGQHIAERLNKLQAGLNMTAAYVEEHYSTERVGVEARLFRGQDGTLSWHYPDVSLRETIKAFRI